MRSFLPLVVLIAGCFHTSQGYKNHNLYKPHNMYDDNITHLVDYLITEPLPSVASNSFCRDLQMSTTENPEPLDVRICYVPKGEPRNYHDDTISIKVGNASLFDDNADGNLESGLLSNADGTTTEFKPRRDCETTYHVILNLFETDVVH
ncbi:MAG: hypothetical protein WC254_01840 [Candidatus Woesearchaeota archaeon]|jgi:hypothetical protein